MAALVIYSHQISARTRPGSYHESTMFIAKPLYDESNEKMQVLGTGCLQIGLPPVAPERWLGRFLARSLTKSLY